MDQVAVDRISGAGDLVRWFGKIPGFHDAKIQDFQIRGDGSGQLRLHSWATTGRVDDKGYFVLEKHFVATFYLEGITHIDLSDFQPGQTIVYSLSVSFRDDAFEMTLDSSYGFAGVIQLKNLRLTFEPVAQQ